VRRDLVVARVDDERLDERLLRALGVAEPVPEDLGEALEEVDLLLGAGRLRDAAQVEVDEVLPLASLAVAALEGVAHGLHGQRHAPARAGRTALVLRTRQVRGGDGRLGGVVRVDALDS
jgi:hypothetical protein